MTDNIIPFADSDPVQDKLERAHEVEAENQKAEFYNYSQVSGENRIESKTSKGRLVTDIDPKTMEVRHRWFTYAETGGPWDLAKAAASHDDAGFHVEYDKECGHLHLSCYECGNPIAGIMVGEEFFVTDGGGDDRV